MNGFSGLSITPNVGTVRIGKRLTPADVHVDRLNSNFLLAYLQEGRGFVAGQVFPTIPTDRRSNYYPKYPKEYWLKSQLALRGPGAQSQEVHFDTDNDSTYFCNVIAGHLPIDEQTEANADAPYNPRRDATKFLAEQALLYREIDWASNFFVTGIWGTSVTVATLWSAANSTPLIDLETGMYTVQSQTGRSPNVFVMGRKVWRILKNHSAVIARLDDGQTSGPATASLDALARLIGVDKCLVMGGIKNTADLGQTASLSFIGDADALLVYSAPSPGRLIPTAGACFAWTGYLGANAEGGRITSWYEPSRKSNLVEIEFAIQHKLIASDLGYFFAAVVA